MEKATITAVSYLNTLPYVFGIERMLSPERFLFSRDVPYVCAQKALNREADFALVPVAVIPEIIANYELLNFGIAATGPVDSVLLISKVPVEEITHIHLDKDSRTSVELIRILARDLWHIRPKWVENADLDELIKAESLLAIGDKAFDLGLQYPFVYDLAEAWEKLTSLPFVFAIWAVRKGVEPSLLSDFSDALAYGVLHIDEVVTHYRNNIDKSVDIKVYLEDRIEFIFSEEHQAGLHHFLSLCRQID